MKDGRAGSDECRQVAYLIIPHSISRSSSLDISFTIFAP